MLHTPQAKTRKNEKSYVENFKYSTLPFGNPDKPRLFFRDLVASCFSSSILLRLLTSEAGLVFHLEMTSFLGVTQRLPLGVLG
jgi:hypothetical protein